MNRYEMGEYDVIVVGAGHAGCEAGLASARMGKRTLVLSIQLEAVALLACNPSIGGTGKGHLVREIDALGGEMGIVIDKTFLQSKMLNRAKGPAVHSLRAQADKARYHEEMKRTLEFQENLDLKQGEAVDLLIADGKVEGVLLRTGAIYRSKAVILATGTFLRGRIFIGDVSYDSGPSGLAPATQLSENLARHGLALRRFKTGTPARALAHTLNYQVMEEQKGDEDRVPFSFMNDEIGENKMSCWLSYTTEESHEIIRRNLDRSALYGGYIKTTGPRYCPSIEDKIHRFSDKARHQLFIEPEGLMTDEVYIQGMSNSLPEDVQLEFYHSIPGLEQAKLTRHAYAIEYDSIDPLTLKPSLEHLDIAGLFCAGQFNGSSGYEEAAAQGLIAGINAVLSIDEKPPFILNRSEAYIGVLIDDLVTKEMNEPYRMMTSRAEYRLVLRQDNADLRLTEKGYELGLASEARYARYQKVKRETESEKDRLLKTWIDVEKANQYLRSRGSSELQNKTTLAELLKRPEVDYESLSQIDEERPQLTRHAKTQVEVQIKYEGYINKQMQQIEKFRKLEGKLLPQDIDYSSIQGLRIEAGQKMNQLKPRSVGQASRMAGVSPADINVLLIWLEKRRRLG